MLAGTEGDENFETVNAGQEERLADTANSKGSLEQ